MDGANFEMEEKEGGGEKSEREEERNKPEHRTLQHKLKSCADFWAHGVDANLHPLKGFKESLTPTDLTGINNLSKPWSQ